MSNQGGGNGIQSSAYLPKSGKLPLTGQTTTTVTPAAGGAGALPLTPAGYLSVTINGVDRQIPYY